MLHTSDVLPVKPSLDYPRCALDILQCPQTLFGLNSNILEVTELAQLPERPQVWRYNVRKKISYLPYGLWDSSVCFLAEFSLLDDGLCTKVDAGMGVKIENTYSIKTEDRGKTWRLEETAKIDCSALLSAFVVSSLRLDHEGLRKALIDRLQNGEQ